MRARWSSRRTWLVGGLAIVAVLVAGIVIVAQFPAEPQQPPLATGPTPLWPSSQQPSAQQPAGPAVPEPAAEVVPGPAGRIVPVHLSWQASGGSGLLGEIDGCVPCGPGVDVLWHRRNLFVMREKGRAELIWAAEERGDNFAARDTGATPSASMGAMSGPVSAGSGALRCWWPSIPPAENRGRPAPKTVCL